MIMSATYETRKTDRDDKLNKEKFFYWLAFACVLVLTIATRFYKVTKPDHVCWDETHFGKMGSWYINRTFFFDVHPPLGKMLIAFAGYTTGYNGTFPFEKPGDKFNGTRYQGMRYFCATLGALIVPLAFDTVYDLTRSTEAASVAAAYLIFDVGLLTLSRYILLDPILFFFMVASIWGLIKVSVVTKAGLSYTCRWWFYLFFTGWMLACTISVKFVGLFVVLLAGLHTANELWIMLGDLQQPVLETLKQLICRSVTLIFWPLLLYLLFFYFHLNILNRSGNGDGFYSSAFQSRLIGNSLYNASLPRDVAYGCKVTIKNHKTGGGYLHSHGHLYPKGSGAMQQQITSYTHKDDNNIWLIKPYDREISQGLKKVMHGDLVRLEHLTTGRNLHSHNERAPISKSHLQVTGYGEKGSGDANDVWKVVIIGGGPGDELKTVTSKFLLVHNLQGCVLTTSGKQLPKWGFEQQEVTCNINMRDLNARWNIEYNQHQNLTAESLSIYAPGILSRFIESHAVMLQGNAGLKPKEGEYTSRPWQWPINYKGQFFSGSETRIYLLGNPIIWWSNLIFLSVFVIGYTINTIRNRRELTFRSMMHTTRNTRTASKITEFIKSDNPYLRSALWLYIGWVLHYLPFWFMGRVLYFHHYFPALIFNSMLSGVMFQCLVEKLPCVCRYLLLGGLLLVLVYSFTLFSPLTYGMSGPLSAFSNSSMHGLKWLSAWEF